MNRIPTQSQMEEALKLRHGEFLQKKFSESRVAVCGLGGLGSNIAVALARAGVGTLILIDFDRVDISNLNRQQYKANQVGLPKTEALAYNLLEIAPYLTLVTHTIRISEHNLAELLFDADVICEAFDLAKEKAMLVNGCLERLPNACVVAASGMAGLASANAIRTRKITERFYLCGDGISGQERMPGLISTRVMLCAAHQAHTVLRILAKDPNTEPTPELIP